MALHQINGLSIRTHHEFPPIPLRNFDWCAVDDSTYEPGHPIGWGPTEQAAIDDLLAEIEEDAAR